MSIVDYIEKKRLEREREIKNRIRKKRARTFAKIITGAGLGAGLGLLFAPKSGKETREDIKNKAKEGKDFVLENVNEIVSNIKQRATELKGTIEEKYDDFSNRNMTEIEPEHIEDIKDELKEDKNTENTINTENTEK